MKLNLVKKIASALAAAGIVMTAVGPTAAFALSCSISGNGADTTNTCDFASLQNTNVTQNNDADIDNNVDVDANTGGNNANRNTGGDVEIMTGDVDVDADVHTAVNTNEAAVDGNHGTDYDLEVVNNGYDSVNTIDVDNTNRVNIDQDNDADIDNNVDVTGDSGNNRANRNTDGAVSIDTGDVDAYVHVSTTANANSASVGDGHGGGMLSARIAKNGDSSVNDIDFALLNNIDVDQDNDADIDNGVDVDGNSGGNRANRNTGDPVEIMTGDVDVDVTVDTMANFNAAEVDGSYIDDAYLEIEKNGADTVNNLMFDLTDRLGVDQDNDLDMDCGHGHGKKLLRRSYYKHGSDCIDVYADTGWNDSNANTGDPVIDTGDATASVGVMTSANANVFGEDMHIDVDMDFGELLDLLDALGDLLGL